MDVISNFAARYERTREEVLSLQEYLEICKRDPLAYATAAERMLKAIGEPELVDTRNNPRLSRIFAIDFERPRSIDLVTQPHFIDLLVEIKKSIDHSGGGASVVD